MNAALETAPATFPTPWAARAFALVNAAAQSGLFDLREFQQALITSIRAKEAEGGCIGDEAAYYYCWIESLTNLVRDRGVSPTKLAEAEAAIRERFASRQHQHDHHTHHDHHGHDHHRHDEHPGDTPRPIFVEQAR